MLIYIDPIIIKYFEQHQIRYDDIEALENIISSHRKGNHFITSSRKCLDFLASKINGLSLLSQKQLKMLSHDYTTFSNLFEKVSTKIIVKPPGEKFKRIDEVIPTDFNNYTYTTSVFEIPLNAFLITERLEKTRIVSEHLDDCYFYEYIGNEFSRLKSMPLSIKFDHTHGGGNDTFKIFEDKAKNFHIVFGVADSDKKEPTDTLGTTSRQLLEKYEEIKETSVVGCEILPVHEKENLFSSIVYEHLGNNIDQRAIEKLKMIEAIDKEFCYLSYLDIKGGLHSDNYLPYFEDFFNIKDFIPVVEIESCNNEFTGTLNDFLRYFHEQRSLSKNERIYKYLILPLSTNPLKNFNWKNVKGELEEQLSKLPYTASSYREKLEKKLHILSNLSDYLLDGQKKYLEILGSRVKEWGLSNPKKTA